MPPRRGVRRAGAATGAASRSQLARQQVDETPVPVVGTPPKVPASRRTKHGTGNSARAPRRRSAGASYT
jgi:hypothetical protein